MNHASPNEATRLEDLLSLEGEQFVQCAYRTLLRRDADPGGLVNYLRFLESGVSKMDIVEELRSSIEGRRNDVRFFDMETLRPMNDARPNAAATVARNVEDLLICNGQQFIESAYLTFLQRQADPAGLKHYLTLLQRSGGKAEVIRRLLESEEYERQASPNRLSGLAAWLASQPRPRVRILNRLARFFGTTSGDARERPATPHTGVAKLMIDEALAGAKPVPYSATPAEPLVAPEPANRAALALMTLIPLADRIAQSNHD